MKPGFKRGEKVAFLMDNGLFTVQLFLGTMYAGLVSVPLNVRAGVAQLASTLQHCDAKVVFVEDQYKAIADEAMAGQSGAARVFVAAVDGFADETAIPFDRKPASPDGEDPALLMYSSGSVGRPKAAIHSHRTLLAHGRNAILSHELSRADRALLVLPLYHINAECVTVMPTLLSGGSIVVPHRFSVSRFWDWLDDYHCTWSAVVPTIVAQLLDWQDPRAESRKAVHKRVRFLRSSSAPLAPSLQREFLRKFELLLIQAMGSTETGNVFSNPLPPRENKIGSPGLAWGFEARIIDRDGADLPPGEPGEVLLRGPAIMQGYYKDTDGTAAVLDAEGWLHTGDLAYRDQVGYFFVVGRSKELIIKGGVNIAPREIDDVLESHPEVLEAAVVGVPDRYVGEDLVAFAVLRAGARGDEREMLRFCESRLGHFKSPSRIHFVSDLPKGPSGKVQRLHLLDEAVNLSAVGPLFAGDPVARGAPARALLAIERTIAESWGELLGRSEIDPDSNFFTLGGHSLMAIACLSKMREKLPVALSLSDFFKHATVAQQAALVRRRLNECGPGVVDLASELSWPIADHALLRALTPPTGRLSIPARAQRSSYPLSPGQQRIWCFRELAPGVPLYNEAEAVRVRGALDIEAMQRAFDTIVARHEILRTTIHDTVGGPTASVHDAWPLKIRQIDLSGMSAAQREAEVERLLIDEPRRLYDLEAEPGIRATVLRLGARDQVFILMMHHIISDRWSMGVVSRELATLYKAFVCGETPALPPPPIQNGDYALWQQQWLAEADFGEDLAYWKDNLRGAPDLLDLPTDRPRPRVLSYRGAKQRFRLDAALAEGLRDLGRKEKTSLFNIFAAALQALLYRYTGSEDLVLGIPIADRERPEVQSLIGFLIDTHALRTKLSIAMTFRELLAHVQTGLVALYSHRAIPFDRVVSRIQPDRDPGRSPLFQVMLNWRDRDQQLAFIGLHGLVVEPLVAQTRTSKLDLTLFMTDGGDGIWLEAEYNTDLFDDQRIRRMFGHYRTLLDAVAADPGQRLAKLPLLTDAERRQLLIDWNRTAIPYPKDRCLHELFEAQVARVPAAVAVVFRGMQLTYRQLDQRANRLANHLRTLGVRAGERVGIFLERSSETVVGLLGILKAGGAYVPLDPNYPAARLVFMIEASGVHVVLTQNSLREKIPAGARLVSLDGDRDTIEQHSTENPRCAVTPDQLAYVMFTSGSTGVPKAVQIPHRAMVNFLASMRREPGIAETDRLLAVTTLSFDIAGLELFLPLAVGACTVIAPAEAAVDGKRLLALIEGCGVTIMQATPATWQLLLETGWRGSATLKILCGGEAWSAELADALLKRCASLWNMYGPTETTIWSSASRIETGDPVLIGPPIANTTFYVLDPNRELVPVGVPGELYIGGVGLARGYLGQPGLTAERFVSDPFVEKPAARMYRTGDLVRRLPGGRIEFLHRLDHQVKLRGFRIELEEIEASLRQHPCVGQCVVTAREEGAAEKQLVAYVVPPDRYGPAAGEDELRDFLRQRLPAYMIPAAFVTLEKLPLMPNGKLDRNALPAPGLGGASVTRGHMVPRTPVEEALAEIWRRVLGLTRLGMRDNFFDLGGHSLQAVRLLAEVNRSFDYQLSVPTFFQDPTIEGMAKAIAEEQRVKNEPQLISLKPGDSAETLFFLQGGVGLRRLAQFLDPGPAVFASQVPWPLELSEDAMGSQLADIASVESLAAPHAALICNHLRSGRCVLVGYSFGGLLAFEVAHQLQREGVCVEMILLLDLHVRAALWWQKLSMLSFNRAGRFVRSWASHWWTTTYAVIAPPDAAAAAPEFDQTRFLLGEVPESVLLQLRKASRRYRYRPLDCRAVLFQSRDDPNVLYASYSLRVWQKLFSNGVEIVKMPGDHASLLRDPHLRLLAEAVNDVLKQVRARKAKGLN